MMPAFRVRDSPFKNGTVEVTGFFEDEILKKEKYVEELKIPFSTKVHLDV